MEVINASRFIHTKHTQDIHKDEIKHIFDLVSKSRKELTDITHDLTEYLSDHMISIDTVKTLVYKNMNATMYALNALSGVNPSIIEPSIPVIDYLILTCKVDPSQVLNGENTLDYAFKLGYEPLIRKLVTVYGVKPSVNVIRSAVLSKSETLVTYAINLAKENHIEVYIPLRESILLQNTKILDIILNEMPIIDDDTLITYIDASNRIDFTPNLDVVKAIYTKNNNTVTHPRTVNGRDIAIIILIDNVSSDRFMSVCNVVEYLFTLCDSNTKANVVMYVIQTYNNTKKIDMWMKDKIMNHVVADKDTHRRLIDADIANVSFNHKYYNICNTVILNKYYTNEQTIKLIHTACKARVDMIILSILNNVKNADILNSYPQLLSEYMTIVPVAEDPLMKRFLLLVVGERPQITRYNIQIIKILCIDPSKVDVYNAFMTLLPNAEYNEDIFEYFSTICDTDTMAKVIIKGIWYTNLQTLLVRVISDRTTRDTKFKDKLISLNILEHVCNKYANAGVIPGYIISSNYFNEEQVGVVLNVSTPIFNLLMRNNTVTEYICNDTQLCITLFYRHTSIDVSIGRYMMFDKAGQSYRQCIEKNSDSYGMLYNWAMTKPYDGINVINILFAIPHDINSSLHSVMKSTSVNGRNLLMNMACSGTVDEHKKSEYVKAHIAYAGKHKDIIGIFTQVDEFGMNFFMLVCNTITSESRDMPSVMNHFIRDENNVKYICRKNKKGKTGYDLLYDELKQRYSMFDCTASKA